MRPASRAFSAPVLAPTVPKKAPQFGAGGNLRQPPSADNHAAKDLQSYPSPHAPGENGPVPRRTEEYAGRDRQPTQQGDQRGSWQS
jgi:hypothetical protein